MKNLVMGVKKPIKADKIKVLHCPQIENLTIKKILAEAKMVSEIVNSLPDKDEETLKFKKSYICNLCYSLIG